MLNLTEGNETKLIWRFALPMLLGNVFQQLYNVVDSIVVGNYLGDAALAAVGASFPILFVLISLVIGIANGTTVIIAQYFGAKRFDKIKQAIGTLFSMLLVASVIVAVIGFFFTEAIFRFIKLPEEVIPDATTYLIIILSASVTLFGFNGTSAILRGLGDSKTPLYFLIIATLANIVLDLLFVIVFHWGITGVAVATVISHTISFILSMIYLNRTQEIIRFSSEMFTFDKEIFKKSVEIGLPTGIQQMAVALGMTALLGIVNSFGTNTIAAYTVAGRIDSFAMMPAMNFSMALSTFVGQNLGANKKERVAKGLKSTLLITTLISIVFSAIAMLGGKIIMGFFTQDVEVINIGAEYFLIVSGFYIAFSVMFSINGVFRGAGDTIIPMFITLFALWAIRVPISYFLSGTWGAAGIWWGIPIAWIAGTVFSIIYFRTGRWKKKVIVKHDEK